MDHIYTVCQGKYQICTSLVEMRMSHWVNTFMIREADTYKPVLDPTSIDLDLESHREEGNQLFLNFRIYPNGSKSYRLIVDFESDKIIYEGHLYDYNSIDSIISKLRNK
ncbi:hypothetical protein [Myroides odoratimimus]|uniref:hypothetical protein n=1 Tax=Myroides odoratimimus TaxID=76832 RepID=UPI003100B062